MKKLLAVMIALLISIVPICGAFAYPTVGTSTLYSLPKTYDSGDFTKSHFPTRYFKGNSSGFEIELNSATVAGTDIDIYTYKYLISSGTTGTWYKHGGSSTDTDELGICSFKASSSYYYCYKLAKSTSGKININYTVRKTE